MEHLSFSFAPQFKGALVSRCRSLSLVCALVFSLVDGQASQLQTQFQGACDGSFNGVSFVFQGFTKNDASYYKGVAPNGQVFYMYWDGDCDGSGDGTPRWVVDTDAPSLQASADLDGDGECGYLARLDAEERSSPPLAATWRVQCGGGGAAAGGGATTTVREIQVTFAASGSTAAPRSSTSTTAATMGPVGLGGALRDVMRDPTTTTTSVPLPPGIPRTLQLDGACPRHAQLNGRQFSVQGRTADGAPYYRAAGLQEYLYYDLDCDGPGGPEQTARWVLDDGRPDTTSTTGDLDADGRCNMSAWVGGLNETTPSRPPASSAWKMLCGESEEWQVVTITLQDVAYSSDQKARDVASISSAPTTADRFIAWALAAVASLRVVASAVV